jgi:hypothetical protein
MNTDDKGQFAKNAIIALENLMALGLREGWPGREIACVFLEVAYKALQVDDPRVVRERMKDFRFLAASAAVFGEGLDPEREEVFIGPRPDLDAIEAYHRQHRLAK